MTKLTDFERCGKLSEVKAVYKSRTQPEERVRICEPEDVVRYLRAIWNRDTIELLEESLVICLNGNHQAMGWFKVSSGGFASTPIDPRVVFTVALQTAANAIILAHNHPSGNLEPSSADRALTRRLKEIGDILTIPLLDHLILTRNDSLSFREMGLL